MATSYSGPVFVTVDGLVLLQSSKVTMEFDSGNKDVMTILLGRAGHSTGPQMVTINVDSAVPAAGVEGNIPSLVLAAATHVLGFKIAGVTYTAEGDLRTTSLSGSVGDPNATSFSFHGKITAVA